MNTSSIRLNVAPPATEAIAADEIRAAWSKLTGQGLLLAVSFATTFNLTLRAEIGDGFSIDPLVLIRLGLCGLCGLYGIWYLPRNLGRLFSWPAILVAAYVGWSAVTALTSVAVTYSLGAVLALACVTVFVPAVLHQLGVRTAILTVIGSLLLFAAASWVLYFAIPEVGRYEDPLTGGMGRVGNDANQLGQQCALAVVLLSAVAMRGWIAWRTALPLALFAGMTLFFTDSRTAWLACLLGLVVVGREALAGSVQVALLAAAAALFSLILLFAPPQWTGLAATAARSGEVVELTTLNGRTDIWAYSWEQAREATTFGYGFGASRQALGNFKNHGYDYDSLHHAHNQVLNAILCTGVLGGVLVAGILLSQLAMMVIRPCTIPDAIVIVVVIAGLVEVAIFGPMPRVAFVLWMMAAHWRGFERTGEGT